MAQGQESNSKTVPRCSMTEADSHMNDDAKLILAGILSDRKYSKMTQIYRRVYDEGGALPMPSHLPWRKHRAEGAYTWKR